MNRSKKSVESPSEHPPEFFVDRNLGRTVPTELERLGWIVHRIADEFPHDAQDVPDRDWIALGLDRGWVPLCKDGRIRGRDHERAPVEEHDAVLFYLDNQQLRIAEMVERIHAARDAIHRAVSRGGPAIYAIGADGIRRTWPVR
jgi:hypothetical protein